MDNVAALENRVDELASLVRTLSLSTPKSDTHNVDALAEQVVELRATMKAFTPGVSERSVDQKIRAAGNQMVSVVTPPIAARIKSVEGQIENSLENSKQDLARMVDKKLHDVDERSRRSMSAHEASGVVAADLLNTLIAGEL